MFKLVDVINIFKFLIKCNVFWILVMFFLFNIGFLFVSIIKMLFNEFYKRIVISCKSNFFFIVICILNCLIWVLIVLIGNYKIF